MKYFITAALVLFSVHLFSQSYIGVHSSNYDPLKSQLFNPATPATSLMKWEVNLFGFDLHAAQDYLELTGGFSSFGDFDRDVNIEENLDGTDKSGNITMDFQGPAFMVNTKKQGAFSFYWRNRTIVDAEDVDEQFLTSMYNDVNNIYNWASSIEDDFLALNMHSFSELALGYSRQVLQIGNHALTAGGTVKLLSPIASGKAEGSFVDITIDEDAGTANFGTTEFSAISSEILNNIDDDNYDFGYKISGFGMDIGAVYEWKTGKGQTKVVGKNKDKVKIQPDYFIKAGIGFVDLGTIKHQHSVYSRTFKSDGNTVSLDDITQDDSTFIDFDDVLEAIGDWEALEGSYKTKLPAAMTLFADIKLTRGIYINVSTLVNLGTFSSDKPKAKQQNIYSVTPRFELPAVGIQMPMAYNQLNGFEMGASIRAGNFVIGSSNLFSWLWSKKTSSVDFQLAVAFGKVDKSKKRAELDRLDEENRWMETGENSGEKKDKKDKKNKDSEETVD